jgi:non-heme Fe2+,alpha-ketoglutarate-dependent halogenase
MTSALPDTALPAGALAQYRRDGFFFPHRVMSAADAAGFAARFEAFDQSEQARRYDDIVNQVYLLKPYLLFGWVDQIVHMPSVLDAAESFLGPDILLWSSGLFTKAPRSQAFVSWHQDATNFELDGSDQVVRAWLALTPTSLANGTMRYAPGLHQRGQIRHLDTTQADGLLSRGETIDAEIDEATTVPVNLDAGEVSFHHLHTPHASGANHSDQPRINLVITYIAPSVRPKRGRDSAMLVRGQDCFGHFEPEPRPRADFAPEAVAAHARAMAIRNAIIFRDAPELPAGVRLDP